MDLTVNAYVCIQHRLTYRRAKSLQNVHRWQSLRFYVCSDLNGRYQRVKVGHTVSEWFKYLV